MNSHSSHAKENAHYNNSPPIPKYYHALMVYVNEIYGIGWFIVGGVWLNTTMHANTHRYLPVPHTKTELWHQKIIVEIEK